MLHESQSNDLVMGYMAIKRLKLAGYGDSRVTPLTTVASLITDIETFRDSVGINYGLAQICDAARDWVQWAANNDLLNTTIVTALTTVATDSVAATTDLSYNFYGDGAFPSAIVPRTANDVSIFVPCSG